MKSRTLAFLGMFFLVGCAGMSRDCSSCGASNFGSDWMVATYSANGEPMACWELHDTAISQEQRTDGIFWEDSTTGNLIHLSGWYNMVQVSRGSWEQAAKDLGVDRTQCHGHIKSASK